MDDVRERLQLASRHVDAPDRPFDRLIERRNRRRRDQRIASAAVALVVATTAIGGAMTMLSRPGRGSRGTEVGGLALGPERYFYLRVRSSEAVDGWIRDLETWWAVDRSGEVRNRSTRQDKYPTPPSGTYGPGEFPVDIAAANGLSPDPEELVVQLNADPWAGPAVEQPEGLWDVVSHLLLEGPNVPPDVRAALFEVARDLRGVTTVEDTRDRLGRDAVAMEFSIDEITWTMHFHPATHQLIAWTSVYKDGPPSWVVLECGIVGSRGERPVGDDWLVPPLPRRYGPS